MKALDLEAIEPFDNAVEHHAILLDTIGQEDNTVEHHATLWKLEGKSKIVAGGICYIANQDRRKHI